jgi:hypothetical protein
MRTAKSFMPNFMVAVVVKNMSDPPNVLAGSMHTIRTSEYVSIIHLIFAPFYFELNPGKEEKITDVSCLPYLIDRIGLILLFT